MDINVIHDLFKGVDIKVDLTPITINKVYDLFKQYNIKCTVDNLRNLIRGIITMDFDDIDMLINQTLKINEVVVLDVGLDMNIVDSIIQKEVITFDFDDMDLNISEMLRQNASVSMEFNDMDMICYGQLIISRSVGSTKSVTVGDCKNLTLFEYYNDTLDSKVGTTKSVTVGETKNTTLFNYYNNTL